MKQFSPERSIIAALALLCLLLGAMLAGSASHLDPGLKTSLMQGDILERDVTPSPLSFSLPVFYEGEGTTTLSFDLTRDEVTLLAESADFERLLFSFTTMHSDSGHGVFVYDRQTGQGTYLGGFGYSDDALVWSPSKSRIFLATEYGIKVLSAETLDYKTAYVPEEGTLHGMLTEFPSFVPSVRWLNDSTLEVTIYPNDRFYAAEEAKPAPLEVRKVRVD